MKRGTVPESTRVAPRHLEHQARIPAAIAAGTVETPRVATLACAEGILLDLSLVGDGSPLCYGRYLPGVSRGRPC
jgi:hypothetical protein